MTSGTSSRYIGYNRDDNVGTMEPNTITILEIEPDVLITQFVAQTLSKNMIQADILRNWHRRRSPGAVELDNR